MKIFETVTVLSQERLCAGVFSMLIATDIAKTAVAGQFVSLYTNSEARLLPRPISICDTFPEEAKLRIVYRIAGEGTREFSRMKSGDKLKALGPNGNGFLSPVKETLCADTKALLIGGGIGIPPLVRLAKDLSCDITTVAGYRTGSDMFLTEELKTYGRLCIATDDGSRGTKGTVIDAVNAEMIEADIIFACGPRPMLKAVKEYAAKKDIPAYLSMEERMACGVGACLGCVCDSSAKDEHFKVNKKRVCVEGPVFPASEVVL